jgi:hypothetical protein
LCFAEEKFKLPVVFSLPFSISQVETSNSGSGIVALRGKNKSRGKEESMKTKLMILLTITLLSIAAFAQQPTRSADQAQEAVAVPRLVNLTGKTTDAQGKPVSGIAGATFSIYKDQYEGAPLWMETQNIQADAKGNYTVQLGANSSQGLPLELFMAGEARWLGVRIGGGEEQPRVPLVSVPYALKAVDADTLGGMPLSAFQLASQSANAPAQAGRAKSQAQPQLQQVANPIGCTSATACKSNFIPHFASATTVTDSIMSQASGAISVAGKLTATGVVTGSSFSIGGKPFAFGSFTDGNALLGFAGNATSTGLENTASGVNALSANTSGGANTASGYAALQSNSSGSDNTGSGWGALANNTIGADNTASGLQALFSNIAANFNTATGYKALFSNNNSGANYNTASGYEALFANTAGVGNTGDGAQALSGNTTGSDNTALGSSAGQGNATGTMNTFLGYSSGPATGETNLINATTIGAFASAAVSNSLILGGTGTSAVTVGIGTTSPYFDYGLTVNTGGQNNNINGGVVVNATGGNLYLGMTSGVHKFRVDTNGVTYADGGFQSSGADFAESLSVRGKRSQYEPGDVLEIDQKANRNLALSRHPYATLVAGIYSTKPGLLASPHSIDDPAVKSSEVPLAVVGIVPCKVTSENGPIARGDLLVTSSRPGYAMRGTDRRRMLGAVVGKALEPMPKGNGVIPVLVTLQ